MNPGSNVSQMSPGQRLREAILRTRNYVGPEVAQKLLSLVTPEAFAVLGGTATVWAAGHFFGVSEVVDLFLVGLGTVVLGSEALTAGREVSLFVTVALQARSECELDESARHLASFIAIVSVDTAIALLLHLSYAQDD
jgi:hypothetical protein